MSARSTTLRGRRAAEALMVDACTIGDQDRRGAYDEASDSYPDEAGAVHYAGPCRVKPSETADRVVQAGEQAVSLWPYTVSVPMTATDVELDDLVVVTASELDPTLAGLRLRVRHVPQGSHLTARRLGCEVQT